MDIFTELGFLGLFLASFLAATLLPLSSELVVTALLMNEYSPGLVVAVATLGNVLGSLTNFALGFWGSRAFAQKVLKISDEDFVKAEARFKNYGVISLFFAWVPLVGDVLTVVAGVLRINVWLFLLIVTAGKLARYLIVSYLLLAV